MNMKLKSLPVMLLVALLGTTLLANAAPSADVTLNGIITNTTCDVTVNNNLSTLNVGVYKAGDFKANEQQGSVPLPVQLTNCGTASGESGKETGALIIQGTTATANPSKQLFTASPGDTVGFMIKDSSNVQIAADENVVLEVTTAGPNTYSFNVGMGSTAASPAAGSYSAPITVAYIVN